MAKQILGRPTGVVYIGQNFVWVGHGLPGLIARTASGGRPARPPAALQKTTTDDDDIWQTPTDASEQNNTGLLAH